MFRIFAAAMLIGTASSAAHANCTSIEVEVLPFQVTRDFSKSYEQLQDIGVSNKEVGLVSTKSSVKVEGCKATVGYKETTLYVAKELKRNECALQHVTEHELHHVAIYEQHLQGIAARIQARAAQGEDLIRGSESGGA